MSETDFKLKIGTQSWFFVKVCGLDKKKKKGRRKRKDLTLKTERERSSIK